MTIIKYMAGRHIVKVPVERESASSVWVVGGHRRAKAGTYFDTWALAREHLLEVALVQVEAARRRLETANAHLGNVRGMKENKQ